MNAAVADVLPKVRGYLEQHPREAFRAVPLAQALKVADIRLVRLALRELKESGAVVTCAILVEGAPADEEFRIVAGCYTGPTPRHLQTAVASPRRGDSSAIPSHFGKGDASLAHATAPCTPAVRSFDPAKTSQLGTRKVPKHHGGRTAWRQASIIAVIEAEQRGVTAREVRELLAANEPDISEYVVFSALNVMASTGRIVGCGKGRPPQGGNLATIYATPEIAKRLREGGAKNTQGSDGEGTSAERPIPAKAAEKVAAPHAAVVPAQKAVQRTAPFDARVSLFTHFRDGEGYWFSFRGLATVARNDVPALMEVLADFQRDGRLEFGLVDGGPMWCAIEGRW